MAQITLPHQLTNGTVADASQVMANFNAIVNVVNGNLGSDNLSSISGRDVTVTDLNGGTNVLDNFTKRFQAGSFSFTDIPKGETVERTITFPVSFPGAPFVFVEMDRNTPNDPLFISVNQRTATGAKIIARNDSGGTRTFPVMWMALYTGAMS